MISITAAGQLRDPDELADIANDALEKGEEAAAIPLVRDGAERHRSALLWQWTALLERSLDRHEDALRSFEEAARLDPRDARIANGRAQTAMEAGLPAVELFEQARALAPRNGQILLGLAAARMAAGEGERAVADLQEAMRAAPMWLQGHEQLAQFMATTGRSAESTRSLEEAIARFPAATALWETLLNVQLRRGAYESLPGILNRARAAGVQSPEFAIYEGIHTAEFDDEIFPAALFDAAPSRISDVLDSWRVRHLLRLGAVDAALPIIDRGLAGNYAAELWAYAATAWRLAGDPRSAWLEGDDRLIRVLDLGRSLPPLEILAETLRALHVAKGEYLDQSVRGGTQTDGPLLSRIDPVIRHLRRAISDAVRDYIGQLPAIDAKHPLLRFRRDRTIRFAGSWSVRLRSGGRHSNHVHPHGWISSALYVSLPARMEAEATDAGWLTLGQPDDKLELDLRPSSTIQPKPGQLVLFPSWMWHGTVPFAQGERLTVAFDVAQPR